MIRASVQDGSYPRPQLVREAWCSLDGEWEFGIDSEDRGVEEGWFRRGGHLPGTIRVPFAPESIASGVADTGYHRVVWYRLVLDELAPTEEGERRILHFGAVDHSCRVWADGEFIGSHEGGQTPFSFDVTHAFAASGAHEIVVRVDDDPHDLELPRGKQDWQPEPHLIWYTRTTGIWRTVWMETVPASRIDSLVWSCDLVAGSITAEVGVRAGDGLEVQVTLELGGRSLGTGRVAVDRDRARVVLHPSALAAGQDREAAQWSPEQPVLIDAAVRLIDDERVVDEIASYTGFRSVGVADGTFQLNGVPYFVRAVLEQGFWPESLLTAPDDQAREREIELIRALGFNTVRIHQKVEDPRFLYWADRLGLLVWGETAATYQYSPRAARLLTEEWMRIVERDRSHPSIVTWVPVNESWGVQDVARSAPQRQFVRALAALTRALDPTRPVVSNDGWEHVDSDIFTLHDYTTDVTSLGARYADAAAVRRLVEVMGPQDRVLSLSSELSERVRDGRVPVMVSEFGGISFSGDDTWGYAVVESAEAYREALAGLFAAVGETSGLSGFCYTQLTDTMQEANGLLTADRRPKLPVEVLRAIVTDEVDGVRRFVWPPTGG